MQQWAMFLRGPMTGRVDVLEPRFAGARSLRRWRGVDVEFLEHLNADNTIALVPEPENQLSCRFVFGFGVAIFRADQDIRATKLGTVVQFLT